MQPTPVAAGAALALGRGAGKTAAMVHEQRLEQTEQGLVPSGEAGWFVLNAGDARWRERPGRGHWCDLEGADDFAQVGVNIQRLGPGEPMAMYHHEVDQEDFLVLDGEAVLVIGGEERRLRRWDFVHCPAGTDHVIVGAGDRPCLVLAIGARGESTGRTGQVHGRRDGHPARGRPRPGDRRSGARLCAVPGEPDGAIPARMAAGVGSASERDRRKR